jgi:hypothetical protein
MLHFIKRNRIVSTLFLFSLGLAALFYLSTVFGQTPNPLVKAPAAPRVFTRVPMTYSECMRTDERYNPQHNRSELRCDYIVSGGLTGQKFAEEDKVKFDECKQSGGKNLSYQFACGKIFYNPDYVFPKTFEECVNGKKGEFTTSVRPRCIVAIDTFIATNINVANNLIDKCLELRGNYSKEFGRRCYMEFAKDSLTK